MVLESRIQNFVAVATSKRFSSFSSSWKEPNLSPIRKETLDSAIVAVGELKRGVKGQPAAGSLQSFPSIIPREPAAGSLSRFYWSRLPAF